MEKMSMEVKIKIIVNPIYIYIYKGKPKIQKCLEIYLLYHKSNRSRHKILVLLLF